MRKTTILAIILTIAIGATAWLLWEPFPRTFDSQIWRNCSSDKLEQRHAMCDDLLRTHKLVGMSRDEIYELLGPPDGGIKTDIVGWKLGYVAGLDDNHLRIYFKDNRVVKYEFDRR